MSDETGLGEGDVGEMAKAQAEAKGAAGRGRGVLCVAVLRESVPLCVVVWCLRELRAGWLWL